MMKPGRMTLVLVALLAVVSGQETKSGKHHGGPGGFWGPGGNGGPGGHGGGGPGGHGGGGPGGHGGGGPGGHGGGGPGGHGGGGPGGNGGGGPGGNGGGGPGGNGGGGPGGNGGGIFGPGGIGGGIFGPGGIGGGIFGPGGIGGGIFGPGGIGGGIFGPGGIGGGIFGPGLNITNITLPPIAPIIGGLLGPLPSLNLNFSLFSPHCEEGRECCQYEVGSADFSVCCNTYGCCPNCEGSCRKCKPKKLCWEAGGFCRKDQCEAGETELASGCRGRRGVDCVCCIKDEVTVTTDCEAAEACCGIEAGTGDFFACCKEYNCCPVCETPGCCYNNTQVEAGTVILDYPDKCMRLSCVMQNTTEPPYSTAVLELDAADGCGCCTLGGELYPDGFLLTDNDYCISVQCVNGNWTNQGFFNAECRTCTVQDPGVTVVTFDTTIFQYTEPDCTYSLVEEGDSYVHIDFQSGTNGFTDHEQITFVDGGSDPITCPASDPPVCSFGTMTSQPTEVNEQGTLAFTMNLGSLEYSVLMGTNGVATLYNGDTLLTFAPFSQQDQLGGICGAFNQDGSDDLTTSDGSITTDTDAFAQSWQVSCPSGRRSVKPRDHSDNSMAPSDNSQCSGLEETEVTGYAEMCLDEVQYVVAGLNTSYVMGMNTTDFLAMTLDDLMAYNTTSEDDVDYLAILHECVEVSCGCPEDQVEMCQDTTEALLTLTFEIMRRTLTPQELHVILG